MLNGIYNEKELEKINEEIGDLYRGTLLFCYKKYANKKFSFITIYPREVPARIIQNFTTEIDWKKHIKESRNFNYAEYESDNENI
jgi:hypothetical protein